MPVILPHTISNGTARDATQVQGNFAALRDFANGVETTVINNKATQASADTAAIATAGTNADTKIEAHKTGAAAHLASVLSFAPTATISSTSVQNAIAEVATDRIAATDALADRATTLEGLTARGGWTTIPLTGGWSNFSGRQVASYRKVGDQVEMRGTLTGGTITDGTILCTLPANFRPPAHDNYPCASSGGPDGGGAYLYVTSTGQVQLWQASNNGMVGLRGVSFSITA